LATWLKTAWVKRSVYGGIAAASFVEAVELFPKGLIKVGVAG
jgi:hypothetical protein